MDEKNFGYLGITFQQSLIKAIIEDKKYGENIIEVLESRFFENNSFKFIMENIKELYKNYQRIPDYNTLGQKIMAENVNKDTNRIHLDSLEIIKNSELETDYVKDTALNFCKQQNLKRELKNVQNIIENGDFENYSKIEEIIQKALQVGMSNDDAADIFFDVERALEPDFRHPIPTGVKGIDEMLKGGVGIGEVLVVLAGTGTGKSTLLTKIANNAYNEGNNVLHIFFEDNFDSIRRKHFTIWTGIPSDEQSENKEEMSYRIKEVQENTPGSIKLLKLPSDGTTVTFIKSKIRKLISDGFKIDELVLDYVDCISPEKSANGEEWKGEGAIMRQLESMADEFQLRIITAVQGGRDSIGTEMVTTNQMGGSIKKAQIAHIVISIGRTIEQKEHNLATITLLKSRIGRDGVVWQNCKFNNMYLEIDTEVQNTLLGYEENKVQDNISRAREALKRRNELRGNNNQ